VTIQETAGRGVEVSAMDPAEAMGMADNAELKEVAQ